VYNPRVSRHTSQIDSDPFDSKGPIRCGSQPVSQEDKKMAKTICKLLGVIFLIVGIAGIFSHDLLGAHLNMAHNMVHIVSGVIALYFGFSVSVSGARWFCLLFGLVYLLLGVCGWILGRGPDHMLAIGTLLMFGKTDHIIHIFLGVVFLAGGALGGSKR